MSIEKLTKILESLVPILYATAWVLLLWIARLLLPKEIIGNSYFLVLYTTVFLFATISKSTSWSIGHDKFGIKGDSRSRIVNYHGDEEGKFWFDLFADNPRLLENDKIQSLIKTLIKKEKPQDNIQT